MEKNEVFKKNVLKRLYGDDINVTPGNDFDATDIPESIIKQGQRSLQQGYVSTAAKKIYTVSLPPAGYTLEEQDVTRETTNEGDSHSGSEDSGGERRGKKHRRRGKVFKSKEVKSGLGFEGESDNQIQTNETEKQLTKGNQSDTSGFTKNQKRKLKKKRRKEREKMQSASQRKEFVYTEANQEEEEEDNSVVEERTPVLRAKKCEDVLRFLFAVWEVYKAEYETKKDFIKIQQEEPLMLEIEAFLKEYENTKELENLCHIKSVLLLGDQNAISQELESWRSVSDLQKDCQELIEGLSKYWLNVMLKR